MLLALGVGLSGGLLVLVEGERRLEGERDALVPMHSELESLQARQRELAPKLQAQQALREQQRSHALERSRWLAASQVLQRLAQVSGRSARVQLLDVRMDEHGLELVAQMPASQLQGWLAALQLPLGPARLIEQSVPTPLSQEPESQSDVSRFVLHFPPSLAVSTGDRR
ncbi:MAG: hypothetical protein WCK08_01535 [Betaproteobacteria bacterium]